MKSFFLTLFVGIFALVEVHGRLSKEEAKAFIMDLGKSCAKDVSATSEDIDLLLKKEVPTAKTGKCMISCIYKQIGIMKDGKYSMEGAIRSGTLMHDENSEEMTKIKKMAKDCESEAKSEDECEHAAEALTCVLRLSKELNFEMPI